MIKINRLIAKPIMFLLHLFRCKDIILVCKGYGDDYELYTELSWCCDKELDLFRDPAYEDYQLWFYNF